MHNMFCHQAESIVGRVENAAFGIRGQRCRSAPQGWRGDAYQSYSSPHGQSEGQFRFPLLAGEPIALTDPPPDALTNVTAAWELTLEPARANGCD